MEDELFFYPTSLNIDGKENLLNFLKFLLSLRSCPRKPITERNNRSGTIMNNTLCPVDTIQSPQTNGPYCIMGTWGGQTAILEYCCLNGPISNFSYPFLPTECYQYCSIIVPGLTWETVNQCILERVEKAQLTTSWVCGPGDDDTSSPSSASSSTRGMNKLGWVLLAIAMVGAVWGAEVAA